MEAQELSWRERGRLWLRLGIRLLLAGGSAGLLIHVAPPLLSLFMPFVLALAAAWMLNPLVQLLQRRLGVSRRFLSLVVIVLILAGLGGLVFLFVWNIAGEIVSLVNNWPAIWESVQSGLASLDRELSRFLSLIPAEIRDMGGSYLDAVVLWLQDTLYAWLTQLADQATRVAKQVPSFAVATVVFFMGAYYLTADYPHIRRQVSRRFNRRQRTFLLEVRGAAVSAFGGYVRAEFILSVGVFFILLIGYSVIQQPYALLLAFLLAILDFIPIIGAGTVMVPWAVVDLALGNLRHAIELMVIWGIIALFRRVGEPKAVGNQTGLPPAASLISIYVGMRLAGVLGMILAPVVCMVVWNICRLGIFDPTLADLRLAAADISAFLKHRPEPKQ
ncbi:sporulation integral membrane protein YtvI [Pseudoflavonifractor sp. 524-17]|uniref:sporulation integral membrane protein YtvI n=1 Tax=Pseudoflavonifractor sp. 524-17 TaxID=2304577 RepID=UPI00137B0EE0|nr:sporulation integral membrane protein YtvI [Pseudoflavonifractor sp. 524-17]